MPEYFLVLTFILIATLLLQYFSKVAVYKNKKHFFTFHTVNLLLASIWDQFAISRGHWSFGENFLVGIKVGFMPIKEFLFVLVLAHFAIVLFKIIENSL